MATLTGKQIRNTYDAILKLEDNDGLDASKKNVTDGLGNATPLSISTTEVSANVNIEATGFKTPSGTSSDFLMADGSTSTGGTGDLTYTHNQSSASATWNVAHNLNKYPSITIVDSANNVVIGEIAYVDTNNCTISFTASFSGKAYAN